MEEDVSVTHGRHKGVYGKLKQITVLSGKGGTGKTIITASFAVLAHDVMIGDCDVDAPNLHMLLHPQIMKTQEFKGPKLAVIDRTKCTECGLCQNSCRFDAINGSLQIDPFSCEGCSVCVVVCPEEAISLQERISGYAFISKTKYGPMSHARLDPGEANSGKLVTLVRHNARQTAEEENHNLILIDGPPGISCPVIASVTGVDAGLVVTEPTLSGIHDLRRALELLNHFNVLPLVCVNKYDINRENTERIVKFCEKNKVEVAGKIPFDPIVTEAMVAGKTIVEHSPENMVSREIETTWKRVLSALVRE
ncbi:MAG: 4Fe-4S binding protein [Candidatus Bathyarchaeota archaeon]|nr:4Fe-4S binding protein [Candidatus Bathyarchaeota archaeon]MDH5732167.1 4Fe-4S binding protein [Candidatus Bathyarchaeota archaeon]